MFLTVNVPYGAEVLKALIPLWVCWPLIVALHIKMLQVLCALYVSSFKQTVKIAKSLPTYYALAYNYITCGKLKEEICSCARYAWAAEKYMDFAESNTAQLLQNNQLPKEDETHLVFVTVEL